MGGDGRRSRWRLMGQASGKIRAWLTGGCPPLPSMMGQLALGPSIQAHSTNLQPPPDPSTKLARGPLAAGGGQQQRVAPRRRGGEGRELSLKGRGRKQKHFFLLQSRRVPPGPGRLGPGCAAQSSTQHNFHFRCFCPLCATFTSGGGHKRLSTAGNTNSTEQSIMEKKLLNHVKQELPAGEIVPATDQQRPEKPPTKQEAPASQRKLKVELVELTKVVEKGNNSVTIKGDEAADGGGQRQCRCLIDLSSPASLERDFYAWLNGLEPAGGTSRPCLFSSSSSATTHSPPPFAGLTAMPSEQLSMLNLADCGHHHHRHLLHQHPHHHFGAEMPAFLVAPSDCSSSASCLSSSSSISPGGGCSFASSTDNSSAASSCSYPIGFHLNQLQLQQQQQPAAGQQKLKTISGQILVESAGTTDRQINNVTTNGGTGRIRRKRNVDKASGRGTNLYGRSYCPGRPLSMEERAQIIHLFHSGMKVNAISKQLCISHGCVSKIITRFRETGNLMPSSHSECRRRKRQQLQLQQQQQQLTMCPERIG